MPSKREITQSALTELRKISARDPFIGEQLSKMIKSTSKEIRKDIFESIQKDPRFNINTDDDIDVVFRHISNTLRDKDSYGGFGSARGSSGVDSRGRSYSLDGLPMLDADSSKAMYKGSLADLSNSRRSNEYSRSSIHDEGTVDVRTGPMTVSNRPLVDRSPMAGPYFCPETPDRVKVDGMYVVSRPDDVRGFYDNGDVMVMRVLGGNSDDDNKPGTARCEVLDVYRKCIQRYEDAFRAGSSRGSNLVNWTFYYDNGGKTDDEQRADDDVWFSKVNAAIGAVSLTTPSGKVTGQPSIVLSRFDGREDFGYVFNHTFTLNGTGNDKFSETNVMRFLKRESPFNVFMDKIIGDDDAIRFIECDPGNPDGNYPFDPKMKEAACERVQRYLKSDQTAVVVLPIDFLYLRGHGFDEKILNLTNIIKNLRRNNRSFYDRIAYYFAKDSTNTNPAIYFKYSTVTQQVNYNNTKYPSIDKDYVTEFYKYQQGNLGNTNLNICYNGGSVHYFNIDNPDTAARATTPKVTINSSTTALFQIIRGSKATDIKEIYIVKEAPDMNQTFAYTDDNEMTQRLYAENVLNFARIPYVTENLLADFVSRREYFPMMTSESAARKYFVRPLDPANPFASGQSSNTIFDYEQLPEDVLMDLKNNVGVIAYPECDGTEGSCVPPQLSAMAQRLDVRLVALPLKMFKTGATGVKIVGLRCIKKATHNNHELYIHNGMKTVTLDANGAAQNNGVKSADCKIMSEDVNITGLLSFFNNEKIPKKDYLVSCKAGTFTGGTPKGCCVPLK